MFLNFLMKSLNSHVSDARDRTRGVGRTRLIGSFLKSLLQKIGRGHNDYNNIMNGGCICLRKARGRTGKGLYMRPYGGGLYIGPQPASET